MPRKTTVSDSEPARVAPPAVPAPPAKPVVQRPPAPPAPTAESVPPRFEIIERGIILSDRRKAEFTRYPTTGDVARLSDGRLVARFARVGCDGTPLFAYCPYDPEADVTKVFLPPPIDWGDRLRSRTEQIHGGCFTLLERNEVLEVQRFRREFPSISLLPGLAGQLEAVVPRASARLFEPGATSYPINVEGVGFSQEWWRGYLELHCCGTWGLYDQFIDKRHSEEELWTRGEKPQHEQNAIAIGTRSGAVLSRWILNDNDQVRWLRPQLTTDTLGERPVRCVELTTAFLRGGAKTLCTIERQPL